MCNTASWELMEFSELYTNYKRPIAYEISDVYENATFLAPNGKVQPGWKYGIPTILGIINNEGNGSFVIIKDGTEIYKLKFPYKKY